MTKTEQIMNSNPQPFSEVNPKLTMDYMTNVHENKYFDRKSAQIKLADLAPIVSSFANAEGGTIVLGISDKTRRIEGINAFGEEKINHFEAVCKEQCHPMPEHTIEFLPVINDAGKEDRLLLIHIQPSFDAVIYTNKDEAYLRIADKSIEMKGENLRNLEYAKGVRHYEEELHPDAQISDLDESLVESYKQKIGAEGLSTEQVFRSRNLMYDRKGKPLLTNAALLLFAKDVQRFHPNCRIRFVRYNGTERKVGSEYNVIKDKSFDAPLLRLVPEVNNFISDQLRDITKLSPDARFQTQPEYPTFAWEECIANSVAHRLWSLRGAHILVEMFDDRLEITSPGKLPNNITIENICTFRYSRNPIICRVLCSFEIVRELNEGVKRIYLEMQEAGLPAPEFIETEQNFKVILRNNLTERMAQSSAEDTDKKGEGKSKEKGKEKSKEKSKEKIKRLMIENPSITIAELSEAVGLSVGGIEKQIRNMKKLEEITRDGGDKGGKWIILK